MIEHLWDVVISVLTNPLHYIGVQKDIILEFSQLYLSRLIGFIIAITLVNVIAYCYLEITHLGVVVWRLGVFLVRMLVLLLLWELWLKVSSARATTKESDMGAQIDELKEAVDRLSKRPASLKVACKRCGNSWPQRISEACEHKQGEIKGVEVHEGGEVSGSFVCFSGLWDACAMEKKVRMHQV